MGPRLAMGRASWHTGDAVHVRVLTLSLKQICGQAASDISSGLLPVCAPSLSPNY